MKRTKLTIAAAIIAVSLIALGTIAAAVIKGAYFSNDALIVNGRLTKLDPGIVVIETDAGKFLYVPLEGAASVLGAEVELDEKNGAVYLNSGSKPDGDGIIASVDGELITYYEFYAGLQEEAGMQVLAGMIDNALLRREAEKAGVTVSEGELEAEMQRIKDNLGDQYEYTLAMYGMTEQTLRKTLHENMLAYEITTKDVVLSEAEIEEEYKENLGNYLTPERVRASHILVSTREEALAVIYQLKKGAAFAELAQKSSIDTGSGQQGGDLGYFGRGEMIEEFEAAAFSLEVGQVSGVVATEYGFHVILCTDKQPEVVPTLSEARDAVIEKLKGDRALNVDELLAKLKDGADILIGDEDYIGLGTGRL